MTDEVVGMQACVGLMHGGLGMFESSPRPRSESRSGHGEQIDVLEDALSARDVHFLAADAGSTDPGPHYLGSGETMTHRSGLKQSLEVLLPLAVRRGIPLIIGSCGMGGTDPGVDYFEEITREVASALGLHFNLGVIKSELDRDLIRKRLGDGRIRPLPGVDKLTEDEINRSSHIVAMQGTEPLARAIGQGAEVVLSGRISDTAMFAAVPLMAGIPLAQAWHLAKVIDHSRNTIEPLPGEPTSAYGIAAKDHFRIEATNPRGRISAMRVAHTTVYENSSPYRMYEPPGLLDVSEAEISQDSPHAVSVRSSKFTSLPYTVKLEGAALMGYRVIAIGGVRDPMLISNIDSFVEACEIRARSQASNQGIADGSYRLSFRVYGRNAVMGGREPIPGERGHEVALLAEAIGHTEEIARAIMNFAHFEMLHYNYPGRKHNTGNVGFPFSPSDLSCGQAYEFNVWHLMELDDPLETCTISVGRV